MPASCSFIATLFMSRETARRSSSVILTLGAVSGLKGGCGAMMRRPPRTHAQHTRERPPLRRTQRARMTLSHPRAIECDPEHELGAMSSLGSWRLAGPEGPAAQDEGFW